MISQIFAIRNQRALEQNQQALALLQSDLTEKRAERDARRDYEYEARKRLYEEYEPLLFQLVELSESAMYRVQSLARSARLGYLSAVQPGWPSTEDYYMLSTLYLLAAPLPAVNLINRRLTLVDLTVDPYVNMQFILKSLNWPFTSDFELTKASLALPYDPFVVDWQKRRKQEPARCWRQGVALGTQEKAVEALIVKSRDEPCSVHYCLASHHTRLECLLHMDACGRSARPSQFYPYGTAGKTRVCFLLQRIHFLAKQTLQTDVAQSQIKSNFMTGLQLHDRAPVITFGT